MRNDVRLFGYFALDARYLMMSTMPWCCYADALVQDVIVMKSSLEQSFMGCFGFVAIRAFVSSAPQHFCFTKATCDVRRLAIYPS